MSENSGPINSEHTQNSTSASEEKEKPRILEVVQIAEAKEPQNATNVIFTPAIMGSLPTQETLDLFAGNNNNVYAAIINNGYKASVVEEYTRALRDEIGRRVTPKISDDRLVLIGFSASCNMVAKTGREMGLPREQVLLVAPTWSLKEYPKERAKGVISSLRQGTPLTHAFGVNTDYAHRLSQVAGGKSFFTGYGSLRRFAVIPVDELEGGIVISGGRDAISPKNPHTNIYVPEAAHKFAQFAPTIIEYISSRSVSPATLK